MEVEGHFSVGMAPVRTKKYGSSVKDSSALPSSMFQLVPYTRIALSPFTSNSSSNALVHPAAKKILAPSKGENKLAHGWLEAMRNLSPPRMRQTQSDPFDDDKSADSDVAYIEYRAWMVRAFGNP